MRKFKYFPKKKGALFNFEGCGQMSPCLDLDNETRVHNRRYEERIQVKNEEASCFQPAKFDEHVSYQAHEDSRQANNLP